MSYFINVRGSKWGLLFRTMEDGKKTTKRIKQNDLLQYGLRPDMGVDEAKARAAQLNKETRYTRREEKAKHRALDSAELERGLSGKHFPPVLVEEFERTRLKAKFEFAGDNPEAKYKKAVSRWRFARRMVLDLDIKAEDWADEPRRFYKYFIDKKISLDYASKVLGVLNLWGHFVGKKQGRPVFPVPAPRGHDREAIRDAYTESEKRKKESLPLTPEMLTNSKGDMAEEHWNWLYVTLWFGLRPKEVGGQWKVIQERGSTALALYQSKLTTVVKEKRWKYIPILCKEQERALKLLKEGKLKRPTLHFVRKALGKGYTLYAGRKGFTSIMLDRGEAFEDISSWLGHLNINQTYNSYKDRRRISRRGAA